MRGLKIRDKWPKLILSGQKTMEVRSLCLPLDHLGDFAVWYVSWCKIQGVTNISSGDTCQTDSDPKPKRETSQI